MPPIRFSVRLRSFIGLGGMTTTAPAITVNAAQTTSHVLGIPNQLKKSLHQLDGLNNVPMKNISSLILSRMVSLAESVRRMTEALPEGSEPRKQAQERIDAMGKRGLLSRVAERKGSDDPDYGKYVIKAYVALFGNLENAGSKTAKPNDKPADIKIERVKAPETPQAEAAAKPKPIVFLPADIAEKEGPREATPDLEALRSDLRNKKDKSKALHALWAVKKIGEPAASLAPEITAIVEANSDLRWYDLFTYKKYLLISAIEALRDIGKGAVAAYPNVSRLLGAKHLSGMSVYEICWAMNHMDEKASLRDIFEYFKDPKRGEWDRHLAGFFLAYGFQKGSPILPELAGFLSKQDGDAAGRRILIGELSKEIKSWKESEYSMKYFADMFADAAVMLAPILKGISNDPVKELRETAVKALALLEPLVPPVSKPEEATAVSLNDDIPIEELVAALKDPKRRSNALLHLKFKEEGAAIAVPELLKIIDTPPLAPDPARLSREWSDYYDAFRVLRKIGPCPEAKAASSKLEEIMKDPRTEDLVMQLACEAFYIIEGADSIGTFRSILNNPFIGDKGRALAGNYISFFLAIDPHALKKCLQDSGLSHASVEILIKSIILTFQLDTVGMSDGMKKQVYGKRLRAIVPVLRAYSGSRNVILATYARLALVEFEPILVDRPN